MEYYKDIFSFTTSQEGQYRLPIQLSENWSWSMREHIRTSAMYKNSQLLSGKDDFKPIKNITRPILNLAYRAEGFDVKDIVIFVEDIKKYYMSFLVKKFHERWARDNSLDTFIDEMVESYVDFGGALVKNVNDVKPEVVPLQSIVFCDQTDILSGPIGIKHFFSPDQLLEMAKVGWGDEKNGATATLEQTITLSREEKKEDQNGTLSQTPGRYVEVYEVHGNFPKQFLNAEDSNEEYSSQLHIICFYQRPDGTKGNITLYKAEEKKSPFKLIKRDPVYGRALGFGGAEELFEPQVWVNYDMIRMQAMLDAASKTLLKTTDTGLESRQKIKDMDNLSVIELAPNTDLNQIDTFPRNMALFEKSTQQWEAHAQQMGAANDSIMGQSPTAGTPFKLQELVTQESHSLHEYRKGKLATFLDEIYRDWIIPQMAREITKGSEFLAELDLEELQYVSDALVRCKANEFIKERILNGETPLPEEVDAYKKTVQDEFKRKGNKHFIQIFKNEFKDVDLNVKTNIAGKQKYLSQIVDKLTNIFRTISTNPALLAQPAMAGLFNQIIEASGLNPVDFTGFEVPQPSPQQNPQQAPQPLQLAPQNA